MREDQLTLRICEDKSVRAEICENGTVHTKAISIDTLIDCFKGSLRGIQIHTGLLPANVVSVSVDTNNDTRYVVMEFPDERADITYRNTTYKDFPLPRLLFGFRVNDSGRICGVHVGVLAPGKLTPETVMYKYPFSNVSRFSMCTGANALPHIQTLQSLQNLPYYILSLPDNDDHYSIHNSRLELEHRDLMEHLQDKDRAYYYDHVLIPMANTTLKDFL